MLVQRFVDIQKDKKIIRVNNVTPNNLGADGFEVEVKISDLEDLQLSANRNGVRDVLLSETDDGYAKVRLYNV